MRRSQSENGCVFKHEFIEYRANKCFNRTKGHCFVKCNKFITVEEYKEQYLDFIRNEKRRSNIMTKARVQRFCKANNINLGYYNDERMFPRSVMDRNNALFLYNNHFLIWKSENISFKQAIEGLKNEYKTVDNYIAEKDVISHFEYIF